MDETGGAQKPVQQGPKRFTLDFPEGEWKPLSDYAKLQKCPVSSIVRLACEAYMIEKGMITKPGGGDTTPIKSEGGE